MDFVLYSTGTLFCNGRVYMDAVVYRVEFDGRCFVTGGHRCTLFCTGWD